MAAARPYVSISTDFGPGNKGHAVMQAVIRERCPEAEIAELATNIQGFDLRNGARLFEAVAWLPKGVHVCVVDPGVGTSRRGLMIETGRGDWLVGPDNGVLLPATGFLGGIKRAYEITNEKYFRHPVSPVFHGRDVFASVAGHLAAGVQAAEIGRELPLKSLARAPYEEAVAGEGRIEAEIVCVNAFGNVFFNLRAETLHKLFEVGNDLKMAAGKKKIVFPYRKTFGEVPAGKPVIVDDDFGRVEAALNRGNLAKKFGVMSGQKITLTR